MSLPSYQVAVMSPVDGSVTRLYDPASFDDLRYSRIVNDVGILTMTMPYTTDNRSAFVLDSFIEVSRTDPFTGLLAVQDTYLCRMMNRFMVGNDEKFVVAAVQLNDLIRRRVIDPADDPNASGGFSIYAGSADTVMYNYAYYNLGLGASAQRRIPNLTIPVPPGTVVTVGYRLQYDDLFKTLFQDAAARGGVDFNIRRTTGANLELDIATIGTDRRRSTNYPNAPFMQFDPDRANMADPNLTIDYKAEKNLCYVLGQGQESARQLLRVAADNAGVSPLNRIEYVNSASSIVKGDTIGLLTAGRTSLKTNAFLQTFTMKLSGQQPGAIYGQDFFLGDLVTAVYDDYSADLRVTGIEFFINQQGETLMPTISPI